MRLHEIQTRNCVKHLEVLEPRSGRRISVSFVPYFCLFVFHSGVHFMKQLHILESRG